MTHMCPVCFYPEMMYPADDCNICPCCGTEFEIDDDDLTHEELRAVWIASGAKWFFRKSPELWNPWTQLAIAGVALPYGIVSVEVAAEKTVSASGAVRVSTCNKCPLAL